MVHGLLRSEDKNLSETTALFMRDVYDHSVHVIDLLETYREVTIGLTETHMNVTNNRMNEMMKVLTMFTAIFMPLSFITGVFGMNFENMPELESKWVYPYGFYGLCAAVLLSMIFWFRRKEWL